jgi:hypothetical protein
MRHASHPVAATQIYLLCMRIKPTATLSDAPIRQQS